MWNWEDVKRPQRAVLGQFESEGRSRRMKLNVMVIEQISPATIKAQRPMMCKRKASGLCIPKIPGPETSTTPRKLQHDATNAEARRHLWRSPGTCLLSVWLRSPFIAQLYGRRVPTDPPFKGLRCSRLAAARREQRRTPGWSASGVGWHADQLLQRCLITCKSLSLGFRDGNLLKQALVCAHSLRVPGHGSSLPARRDWSARLDLSQWRRDTLDKESIWDVGRSTSLSRW